MGEVYRETSDIPVDLRRDYTFYCPVSGCSNQMTISQIEEFCCPECGTGFVIKIVDDVLIPSVRRRGVTGYMMVVRMPEIPRERRNRFIKDHDLHEEQASKLTTSMDVADFYEDLSDVVSNNTAASFIADTLIGELRYRDLTIQRVKSEDVTELVTAIDEDQITRKSAVQVVREALDESEKIDDVFADKDIEKTDEDTLKTVVEDVVQSEQEAVQDYLDGEEGAINYLVGQVMSQTGGQADAEETREVLTSEIEEQS